MRGLFKVISLLGKQIVARHVGVYILLTKTTAAQNEAALSYHRVRGLYFLTVVFVVTIVKGMGLWYKLRYWLGFVLGYGLG